MIYDDKWMWGERGFFWGFLGFLEFLDFWDFGIMVGLARIIIVCVILKYNIIIFLQKIMEP